MAELFPDPPGVPCAARDGVEDDQRRAALPGIRMQRAVDFFWVDADGTDTLDERMERTECFGRLHCAVEAHFDDVGQEAVPQVSLPEGALAGVNSSAVVAPGSSATSCASSSLIRTRPASRFCFLTR